MHARAIVIIALVVATFAAPVPSGAQSLGSRLSLLLTQQQPTSVLVPDVPAAEATRDTVGRLFSIELSHLPVASSSGGFVYRLNPSLGVVERASEGFGPFFTERVLRNGKGQATLGLSYQFANFTSLQGADLGVGTFPTNAARMTGTSAPFSVDTLDLQLESQTTTVFSSYGVTDRFAVGASVPFVKVHFSGTRVRNESGKSTLQSSQWASATGLGDSTLNARYQVVGSGLRGVSLGTDFRLPTGRSEDLLGSGHASTRFLAIGSYEEGRLSVNVNGTLGVGGASREQSWSMASTFAAVPRVTLVGEVLGRRLSALSTVQDVYQPHPLMPGVETMRWLTAEHGAVTTLLVVGAKWNIGGSLLVNPSMLIRVTDVGLRARVTPGISFDYEFDR